MADSETSYRVATARRRFSHHGAEISLLRDLYRWRTKPHRAEYDFPATGNRQPATGNRQPAIGLRKCTWTR
ncbi:hypothetical protein [Streptomyces rishiriensis]|uniref:Uncharacterized protein n=1 Tax=Streptomyces rishiriensis TaxID=68264 RepID=A0ABU0NI00_STRRH|nr:hypothetical protein [Streptomyces rishiriensis]MDQ0578752.1 hypothetical protein [Streptomyces rishiriensis]